MLNISICTLLHAQYSEIHCINASTKYSKTPSLEPNDPSLPTVQYKDWQAKVSSSIRQI
jgi:hypothetical protein